MYDRFSVGSLIKGKHSASFSTCPQSGYTPGILINCFCDWLPVKFPHPRNAYRDKEDALAEAFEEKNTDKVTLNIEVRTVMLEEGNTSISCSQ